MNLPAEAYSQGEPFQLEKRRLFAKEWLPFCAAAQVAETGRFVNHALGGWPSLVIRGADGTARAFRNVCRHQGMPVVEKPGGHCDPLRCRYHGWTYDLEGALVSAPPLVAPQDPASVTQLERLGLVETGGLIYIRNRPGGAPHESEIDLAGFGYVDAVTTDVDANWKSLLEFLLPDPAWRFVWPLCLSGEIGGLRVVRQIVPRSFSRSRMVDLLFADAGDAGARATDAVRAAAAGVKAGAQALQAQRGAGDSTAAAPAILAFRERLAAACGLTG